MKSQRLMIAPPYVQFFISDVSLPESPIQTEKIQVVSNGLCLSVPCLYHQEGDTELIVGEYEGVPKNGLHVFDGTIPTPSRVLLFSDAELTELLRYPVSNEATRLRIWTDGMELPSRVVVSVD